MDALSRGDVDVKEVGSKTILLSSHTESLRYCV